LILQIFVTSGSSFALKNLGEELQKEHFEKIQLVTNAEEEIENYFSKIFELGKQKRPVFEHILDMEIEKEKIRMDYARVAGEFLHWAKDMADRVNSDTHFGFILSEVR
jgi:hypothetical protein